MIKFKLSFGWYWITKLCILKVLNLQLYVLKVLNVLIELIKLCLLAWTSRLDQSISTLYKTFVWFPKSSIQVMQNISITKNYDITVHGLAQPRNWNYIQMKIG